MVIRKILLTLSATLLSLSIFAHDLLPTTAILSSGSDGAGIFTGPGSQARSRSRWGSDRVPLVSTDLNACPVSADGMPIVLTVSEPLATVESEHAAEPPTETAAASVETLRSGLESYWVDMTPPAENVDTQPPPESKLAELQPALLPVILQAASGVTSRISNHLPLPLPMLPVIMGNSQVVGKDFITARPMAAVDSPPIFSTRDTSSVLVPALLPVVYRTSAWISSAIDMRNASEALPVRPLVNAAYIPSTEQDLAARRMEGLTVLPRLEATQALPERIVSAIVPEPTYAVSSSFINSRNDFQAKPSPPLFAAATAAYRGQEFILRRFEKIGITQAAHGISVQPLTLVNFPRPVRFGVVTEASTAMIGTRPVQVLPLGPVFAASQRVHDEENIYGRQFKTMGAPPMFEAPTTELPAMHHVVAPISAVTSVTSDISLRKAFEPLPLEPIRTPISTLLGSSDITGRPLTPVMRKVVAPVSAVTSVSKSLSLRNSFEPLPLEPVSVPLAELLGRSHVTGRELEGVSLATAPKTAASERFIPAERYFSRLTAGISETVSGWVRTGTGIVDTVRFSELPIAAPPAMPGLRDALGDRQSTLTARSEPVLINGLVSFSPAMTTPMPYAAKPLLPAISESMISEQRGPSAAPAESNDDRANTTYRRAPPSPVVITAQPGFSMDMLRPLNTNTVYAVNPFSRATPIAVSGKMQQDQIPGSFCDPKFVGPPIRFAQTVELKLDDLLGQLNARFGVNFIVGPEIGSLPLNVKAGSIPWNVLLRSQLYVSGVRATCIDANTVQLVLNSRVGELEIAKIEAEALESRYIKLKYLQPSSSGNKNIAGQSTGGGGTSQGNGGAGGQNNSCQSNVGSAAGGGSQNGENLPQRCKFERLKVEIEKILGISGNSAPGRLSILPDDPTVTQRTVSDVTTSAPYRPQTVSQVPGRNMFFVRGTAAQLAEVTELIRRADVPPFQVVIKGLVYTANEDKLRDIGVQTTIVGGTADGRTTGGLFGHTIGGIGTLFDFSTLIGTFDFNVQATALQRDGVISIKSRPFATVLDGDTTDLTVGRQVPVLIQAINPIGGAPGTLQILQAANLLSVTPHVIDDENGNPTAVNLELQLESNDVDTSVSSQGVPAVSVRSIQSNFIITQEQTAILGGFTVDSDSKTVSKTPGLGDIPILGELFKRRVRARQINRLYFAISVSVIPYGGIIEPVRVPGATTDPPSLTPELLKRSQEGEPKSVVPTPRKTPDTR